jgi:methyl-accepting chemotaxis protein
VAARLEDSFNQLTTLRTRLDEEVASIKHEAEEQRDEFKQISEEIATIAAELRATASAAEESLKEATGRHTEIQKQTSSQLSLWTNDSETLKNDVKTLQTQLAQFQQSFKQFLITIVVIISIMAFAIFYLMRIAR